MIQVDEVTTLRLAGGGLAEDDPYRDVSRFVRATGLKAVRLPCGAAALGWDHHDGTFGVLEPVSGSLDGAGGWRSGRIEPEGGRGFMTHAPLTLWSALRESLTMPSPLVDGEALDAVVADAREAEETLEAAVAAPVAGM